MRVDLQGISGFLLKLELGADTLARRVLEFMGKGTETTFSFGTVVAPSTRSTRRRPRRINLGIRAERYRSTK